MSPVCWGPPEDSPWADLDALRAVCASAELGGVQAAAKVLSRSPTSLSRSLQAWQRSCGFKPAEVAGWLERAGRALSHLAVLGGPEGRVGVHSLSWLVSGFARQVGLRQLQTLVWLERSRCLEEAARCLGVGVATVQQRLAQIEPWAAAPLCIRTRRSLVFTEAGELAAQAARLALAELAQAHEAWTLWLGGSPASLRGRLVVGVGPGAGACVSRAVHAVQADFPGLGLHLVDGSGPELLRRLERAELDLLVSLWPADAASPALASEPLFETDWVVAVRPGHALAGRQGLRWDELAGASWIVGAQGLGPPALGPGAGGVHGPAVAAASICAPGPLRTLELLTQSDRLAWLVASDLDSPLARALAVRLDLPPVDPPARVMLCWRAGYLPPPGAQGFLQALRRVAGAARSDS